MRRRRALFLLAGTAAWRALVLPAAAQAPLGGEAWLRRVLERATDILTSPGSDPERRQAFGRMLADEVFDFAELVRQVLGHHWNRASETQRRDFADALRDYLIAAYARILRRWFAGEAEVFASRLAKDGLAGAVNEELARADKTLSRVDWSVVAENENVLVFATFKPREGGVMRTMIHVVKRGAAFRIVDIWIAGVSLARTHRDDVGAVIRAQSGDLNAAIDVVRRKTAQLQQG